MKHAFQLIHGDCFDVFSTIPDSSVDMVLCDLPYGTTRNPWDKPLPLNRLWGEYRRILSPTGVVCLTGQGLFTAKLILSNEKDFRYRITWVKSKPTNFLNARRQPLRCCEDICVFYRKQPPYFPQMSEGDPYDKGVRKNRKTGSYGDFAPVRISSSGKRFPKDVLYFKTAESEGESWHPTQKPLALGRYLVRTYTRPDSLVLDNCAGSASFPIAAALEGRKAIGIESCPEFVRRSLSRAKAFGIDAGMDFH